MAMTGFICQDEYLAKCAKLSDQEVGRLFRALMEYHATGHEPELAGRESIAFDFIKEDIDKAEKAYAAKCEKNRQNRIASNENGRSPEPTPDNERQRTLTNVDERTQNINKKEKENKRVSKDTQYAGAFAVFWAAYPRHTDKQAALRAFERLKPDETMMQTILGAIERQKQSQQWTKDGGQFIPHPATWLNGRRWEDEMPKGGGPVKTVSAQQYGQRHYTENELLSVSDDLIAEARRARETA